MGQIEVKCHVTVISCHNQQNNNEFITKLNLNLVKNSVTNNNAFSMIDSPVPVFNIH